MEEEQAREDEDMPSFFYEGKTKLIKCYILIAFNFRYK